MNGKEGGKELLVERIVSSPRERVPLFRTIPKNEQGFVLLLLSKHIQQDILSKLRNDELVHILNYVDPDDATDLLQNCGIKRRLKVVKKLNGQMRKKVEFLLKFNPQTAAGMMNVDYIEVEKNTSFEQLSKVIKRHEKRTGRIPSILVVEEGFLVGELPLHAMALAHKNEKIKKFVKRVPFIQYDKSEREVIAKFRMHPHNKIVVLDENNSIVGIIYSDDILKILEKHSAGSLRDFAGVSKEEDVLDSPWLKVKYRYKWLMLNLLTAFLAAGVVSLFQKTISAFILLAVYMPIVAGMGGNTGTQTLAVMVRGMTLKKVNRETGKKIVFNEMIAGGINGLINGSLVALIAILWNKNPLLGVIVGVAMIINLFIAGLFGAIIPLLMRRLGKDPATSATVFITTATDICGFFVFLGLATLIL